MAERKRKLDIGMPDAVEAPNGGVNPFTLRPYSQRYYDILKTRRGERLSPPSLPPYNLAAPAALPPIQPAGRESPRP